MQLFNINFRIKNKSEYYGIIYYFVTSKYLNVYNVEKIFLEVLIMINDQRYVILSLELHLFFARIMKEHSLFLEAGFTPKDFSLANEAEFYKNEFENLLSDTVDVSNGIIRSNVLNSGEIVTDFTLETEKQTQNFTGISIKTNITKRELELCSGRNPRVRSNLVRFVSQLNADAQRLLRGLIDFKQRLLDDVLSCNILTFNYPLLIEHILREAKLYLSLVNDLENGVDIDSMDTREIILGSDYDGTCTLYKRIT